MKKKKNKVIFLIILTLLLLPGRVFPAQAPKSYLNPLEWLSKLFPKKEDPLRLKLQVPPPPPPSILYGTKEEAEEKREKSPPPLPKPVKEPSPWQWY